jgi:alpha-ribazole phosphatase
MDQFEWAALRHGETVAGHCYLGRTDAALTELGWKQMSQAFQVTDVRHDTVLAEVEFDLIITSPLLRCYEFAETLSNKLHLELITEPRLQEFDFGDWDGLTSETIYQNDPESLEAFWGDPLNHPPPNGETLDDFAKRLKEGSNVIETYVREGRRPIVITHGGVIKALRCLQAGWSFDKMWEIPADHGSFHRFNLD